MSNEQLIPRLKQIQKEAQSYSKIWGMLQRLIEQAEDESRDTKR